MVACGIRRSVDSHGLSLARSARRWLGQSMTFEINGIISALVAGSIIGLIARILVPSIQPIGCIVTIIIGIIGAFAGLALAGALGYASNFFLVLITQIFIAVVLVAITAALFRKGST